MRDHEARIHAAIAYEKRWQTGKRRIDQQRDPALRQRTNFRSGDSEVIGGECNGFRVEIAAREHFAGVREDQRIVRYGIRFDQQDIGRMAHLVETRAHDLRLATQAVRVLNLVAILMRQVDRGTFQQRAIGSRRIDLSGVTAQRVNAGVERNDGTHRGIHRQRARHQPRAVQVFDREHVVQRERRGSLRAVEQRKTFFSLQRQRFEAGYAQPVQRTRPLATDGDFANTEQRRRHMRKRRQIARCAHRTLDRDDRQDIGVEQRDQRVDHLAADARMPAPQARHLQRDQQPHDRSRHGFAHAHGMRQHQIALQQFELIGGNVGARQTAETRVDSVGRLALGGDVGNGLCGSVDGSEAGRIEG
ncbi:hypothetical protein BSU04_43375 [Caballeronia sordidicola]|uniref:Uncharacterized protein n=1 Tax=Caballeronia sordidicola TaxID=196367 RepID=A0A226WNF0_CABSO|nr:hypothetical protein BSU04_43375 [Caballeronia sordidicola]